MGDGRPDAPAQRETLAFANPGATVRRLAAALEPRIRLDGEVAPGPARTWVLGADDDPASADRIAREAGAGARIVVVGWIGTHPDARAETLRRLWALEERCRATRLPVLALRLGPVIAAASPLWRKLAATTPAPKLARKLVHPVLESDVIETLARALAGASTREGWYEIGGHEVLSVAELAALARDARPEPGGDWEPAPDALAEQRLIEPDVWARWSGVAPGSVLAAAAQWAA